MSAVGPSTLTSTIFTLAIGVVLGMTGCGGGAEQASRTTARDSMGVSVVTTHRLGWESTLSWPGGSRVSIPAADGGPARLSSVVAARLLQDGRIAVLDRLARCVFLFSSSGELLDSLGGNGQGPGELVGPLTLDEGQDGTLRVYDAQLGRITAYQKDGTLRRIVTLQSPLFDRPPMYAWLLQDGRVLTWEFVEADETVLADTPGARRIVTPGMARLVDLGSGKADTLLHGSAQEWIAEGGRWWFPPFGPSASMELARGRLYLTRGDTHEVRVVQPDSGVVAVYRYPEANQPLSMDELGALDAEGRADAEEGGYPYIAGVIFTPELQPKIRPSFMSLRIRDDGTIWAEKYAPFRERSGEWWVIDETGAFVGMVELPVRGAILDFTGDRVLLLALDELDVPSLEVWTLPAELP